MTSRLKKLIPPLLLLALLVPAAACDSGSSPSQPAVEKKQLATAIPDQVVLVEIDDRRLTGADLKRYLALFKDSEAALPAAAPEREKLVNHLIDRVLLLEAARRDGYFKIDELKKHGSLSPGEHETIVLRAYLTDKISRPATPDQAAVEAFRRQHPDLDRKAAREKLIRQNQLELFRRLMTQLRKEHRITIHHDTLAGLPAG